MAEKELPRTDEQTNSEIADFLADALQGAEEARGLAEEQWGEHDQRTEALLNLWAEVETQLRIFQLAVRRKKK